MSEWPLYVIFLGAFLFIIKEVTDGIEECRRIDKKYGFRKYPKTWAEWDEEQRRKKDDKQRID